MCVFLSHESFAAESGQHSHLSKMGGQSFVLGTRTTIWDLRGIQVVTISSGYMLGIHQCPAACPQRSLSHFILGVKGSPRVLLAPASRDACIRDKSRRGRTRASDRPAPGAAQLQEGDAPAVITWFWGLWLESMLPSWASQALVFSEAHGSRPRRFSADAGV